MSISSQKNMYLLILLKLYQLSFEFGSHIRESVESCFEPVCVSQIAY